MLEFWINFVDAFTCIYSYDHILMKLFWIKFVYTHVFIWNKHRCFMAIIWLVTFTQNNLDKVFQVHSYRIRINLGCIHME